MFVDVYIFQIQFPFNFCSTDMMVFVYVWAKRTVMQVDLHKNGCCFNLLLPQYINKFFLILLYCKYKNSVVRDSLLYTHINSEFIENQTINLK